MAHTYLEALVLLALVTVSAFFSACELAFTSLSSVRLHSLAERKASGADSLARLRANRRRVLISILIWNNLINIAASAFATSIAISFYGEEGVGIAVGVMTFMILTLGEIVPKSVATVYGEKLMLFASPLLEFVYYLTFPFVVLFEQFNRLIPGVYARGTAVERFTEEEVRSAVKLGAKHQGISEKERELIENVLAFNDKTVAQAMTPRNSVVALPSDMPVGKAYSAALDSSYSRFPVLKGNRVTGTLSIKILGRAARDHPGWTAEQAAWEPVKFVSGVKANAAFSHMQSVGRNIAVVVSEKDEFLGVVTLEDLLEELVGEIK